MIGLFNVISLIRMKAAAGTSEWCGAEWLPETMPTPATEKSVRIEVRAARCSACSGSNADRELVDTNCEASQQDGHGQNRRNRGAKLHLLTDPSVGLTISGYSLTPLSRVSRRPRWKVHGIGSSHKMSRSDMYSTR